MGKSHFEEIGRDWVYFADGSGAEYYAKTSIEELEEWQDTAADFPPPFEIAVPEGAKGLLIYQKGENYPSEKLNLDDINEVLGTKYEDWDDFLESDEY